MTNFHDSRSLMKVESTAVVGGNRAGWEEEEKVEGGWLLFSGYGISI